MLLLALFTARKTGIYGLQNNRNQNCRHDNKVSVEISRRDIINGLASVCGAGLLAVGDTPKPAWSADSLDVDAFLRKGVDSGGGMGVSSQAGKSRPETGVFLREGSEVSRNRKTGDVNAEIVVNGVNGESMAVFVGYSSPWSLGKTRHLGTGKSLSRLLHLISAMQSIYLNRHRCCLPLNFFS